MSAEKGLAKLVLRGLCAADKPELQGEEGGRGNGEAEGSSTEPQLNLARTCQPLDPEGKRGSNSS